MEKTSKYGNLLGESHFHPLLVVWFFTIFKVRIGFKFSGVIIQLTVYYSIVMSLHWNGANRQGLAVVCSLNRAIRECWYKKGRQQWKLRIV